VSNAKDVLALAHGGAQSHLQAAAKRPWWSGPPNCRAMHDHYLHMKPSQKLTFSSVLVVFALGAILQEFAEHGWWRLGSECLSNQGLARKREEHDAVARHKLGQHRKPGRQVTGCSAGGPALLQQLKARFACFSRSRALAYDGCFVCARSCRCCCSQQLPDLNHCLLHC
jgi:hypothetical protein